MRLKVRFAEKKPERAVRHIRAADARVVPWKNGRGKTHELALWPPQASLERLDFDWRVSTAPVTEPGPFSALLGLERILVVTEGAGLVLVHGAAAPRAHLRRLEPYRFSGDWPTAAELPHGPVRDFNVIFTPARVRASVQAVPLGERRLREAFPAGQAFVHVLAGTLTARVPGEEETLEIGAGESLWVRGLASGEELDLAGRVPGCELVLVALEEVGT